MGSQLVYTKQLIGETQDIELWSEYVFTSLKNLTQNPGLLKFNPNTTVKAKSIIRFLRFPKDIYKVDVYNSIERELTKLVKYDFRLFPYDWRRDITINANILGDYCKEIILQHGENNRFTFVGHSMGGLVISETLIKKFIDPAKVDRVITIGTPFGGSPNAFKGLYSTGYLPGVDILGFALNFRLNKRKCRNVLLEAHQSFHSIYQLLPNGDHKFIELAGEEMINLLSAKMFHNSNNLDQVSTANSFHKSIRSLSSFKVANRNIKFLHNGFDTDYFLAANVGASGRSFENIKVTTKFPGDGTVPAEFASADGPDNEIVRNVGSKHMTMCSNIRILERISMELSSV
jgi:hypothetical protein